jgi:diphthine methyl ester synthase
MTLYLIGLGLNDHKDITVKGLEAIKKSDIIYLENYTSKLNTTQENLERFYGKKIILADRNLVEKKAESVILDEAKTKNVALLIIGDVFGATTHIDLLLRAKKDKITVEIIHNASIISAVGITGLEIYKFGRSISIPFNNINVTSPADRFKNNYENNLHTLFLLDIDPENDKYLTFSEAAEYLIRNGVDKNITAVGCAQIGSRNPLINVDDLKNFKSLKIDKFPQCLIVPAKKLHFIEEEALNLYR